MSTGPNDDLPTEPIRVTKFEIVALVENAYWNGVLSGAIVGLLTAAFIFVTVMRMRSGL